MNEIKQEFEIEISQIFQFEKTNFNKEGFVLKKSVLDQLLLEIQNLYIEFQQPFCIKNKVENTYWEEKIAQWKHGLSLKNPFCNDLIYTSSKIYSLYDIFKVSSETRKHHLWFALKLRQFNKSLFEIEDFLNYHLVNGYLSSSNEFSKFLKLLVRQYSKDLFSQELKTTVEEWLNKEKDLSRTDLYSQTKKIKTSPKTIKGKFLSYKLASSNPVNKKFTNDLSIWDKLKSDLIKNGFLDKENTAKQLLTIFQNKNIEKESKVIWSGTYKELNWFLLYLIEENGIVEHPGNDKWYLATKCFFYKQKGQDFEISQVSKATGNNTKRYALLKEVLDKYFAES